MRTFLKPSCFKRIRNFGISMNKFQNNSTSMSESLSLDEKLKLSEIELNQEAKKTLILYQNHLEIKKSNLKTESRISIVKTFINFCCFIILIVVFRDYLLVSDSAKNTI
jgi:hypothetical protein